MPRQTKLLTTLQLGHGAHAIDPAEVLVVLAGHEVATIAPVPETKLPGGASVQALDPAVALNDPGEQRVAAIALGPAAKLPAGAGIDEAAPNTDTKRPAGAGKQSSNDRDPSLGL